jgi:hypothetical protein
VDVITRKNVFISSGIKYLTVSPAVFLAIASEPLSIVILSGSAPRHLVESISYDLATPGAAYRNERFARYLRTKPLDAKPYSF